MATVEKTPIFEAYIVVGNVGLNTTSRSRELCFMVGYVKWMAITVNRHVENIVVFVDDYNTNRSAYYIDRSNIYITNRKSLPWINKIEHKNEFNKHKKLAQESRELVPELTAYYLLPQPEPVVEEKEVEVIKTAYVFNYYVGMFLIFISFFFSIGSLKLFGAF